MNNFYIFEWLKTNLKSILWHIIIEVPTLVFVNSFTGTQPCPLMYNGLWFFGAVRAEMSNGVRDHVWPFSCFGLLCSTPHTVMMPLWHDSTSGVTGATMSWHCITHTWFLWKNKGKKVDFKYYAFKSWVSVDSLLIDTDVVLVCSV